MVLYSPQTLKACITQSYNLKNIYHCATIASEHQHWKILILLYFTIPKTYFIIIPYHFTIPLTSQNFIFIKILFFNLSLLFSFQPSLFLRLGMIPTAPPSPITTPPPPHLHLYLYGSTIINHHTTTSTAPPSSITKPPLPHHHQNALASHHTHYTIRKPKPISAGPQPLMNVEELMNPDTADQRQSQQGEKKKTQINPNQNPDTAAARSMFPPSLINH